MVVAVGGVLFGQILTRLFADFLRHGRGIFATTFKVLTFPRVAELNFQPLMNLVKSAGAFRRLRCARSDLHHVSGIFDTKQGIWRGYIG